MGILIFRIVNPGDPPFADASMLDACIDPQFNGVFPDDPGLGIVSERKANARVPTNFRANQYPRRSPHHKTEHNDPRPSRLR